MAQQNNDNSGAALVGVGFMIAFCFLFAFFAFVVLVMSVICLFAWNRPITLMKGMTVKPEEARGFIYGGLAGAVLGPVFVAFCAGIFKLTVIDQVWGFAILGGYTLGAICVAKHFEEEERKAAEAAAWAMPPVPQIQANVPKPAPPAAAAEPNPFSACETCPLVAGPKPGGPMAREEISSFGGKPSFRFADWKDEEELR